MRQTIQVRRLKIKVTIKIFSKKLSNFLQQLQLVSGSIEELFATLETTVSDDMQSPRSLKSLLSLSKSTESPVKFKSTYHNFIIEELDATRSIAHDLWFESAVCLVELTLLDTIFTAPNELFLLLDGHNFEELFLLYG